MGPPEHCGTEDVCAWARTRTDSSSARGWWPHHREGSRLSLVAREARPMHSECWGPGTEAALGLTHLFLKICLCPQHSRSRDMAQEMSRDLAGGPCKGQSSASQTHFCTGRPGRSWGATGLVRLPGPSSFCVTTIGLSSHMGTCLNTQNRKDLLSVLGVFQNLPLRHGLAGVIKSWRGSRRLMSHFQGGG